MKEIKLVYKTNVARVGRIFRSWHKRGKHRSSVLRCNFYQERTHRSNEMRMMFARASISSSIRMHQYCSHVRGRMKSSRWEKYCTCPPRSMRRRARAIVRPLFRFFIASDQNWIMQWTRAGGSGSASRSKSSEHHLSVHTEEKYTHMYVYM